MLRSGSCNSDGRKRVTCDCSPCHPLLHDEAASHHLLTIPGRPDSLNDSLLRPVLKAWLTGPSPFGVRSECEAVGMGRYNM